MLRKLFITLFLALIVSCSSGTDEDLQSPCVSAKEGPCGPKKPINNWLS